MSKPVPSTSKAAATCDEPGLQLPPFPDQLDLSNIAHDDCETLAARLHHFRLTWQTYAKAAGLYDWPAERQKSMLLSAMGPVAAKVYRDLQTARKQPNNNAADDDDNEDDDEDGGNGPDVHRSSASGRVLAAIIRHLLGGGLRLRRMAAAKQARYDGEPYWRFIERLRTHINACEYAERTDDVLLDRIIAGLNNQALSEELCFMVDLTLSAAIERVRLEDKVLDKNRSRNGGAISKNSRTTEWVASAPLQKSAINNNAGPVPTTSKAMDANAPPLAIKKPTTHMGSTSAAPLTNKAENCFDGPPANRNTPNNMATPTNALTKKQVWYANYLNSKAGRRQQGGQHAQRVGDENGCRQRPQQQRRQQQKNPPKTTELVENVMCFRCGDRRLGHDHMAKPQMCPSQGQTCAKCGGLNHIANMCSN